ncbi:Osteoclast-stimulating factor 1, partial [Stegodyphus mimosarum]
MNIDVLPCKLESELFVQSCSNCPYHLTIAGYYITFTSYTSPDELSFEEGDNLYILDVKSDVSWWKASCRGKIGLIPSNYGNLSFS